jgi:hypothetical protein
LVLRCGFFDHPDNSNHLGRPPVEVISYSQFKSLVQKDLIGDLVIRETAVEGNMKGEAVKEILTPEKLKTIPQDVREGKKPYPFVAVRVEDPGLTAELEAAEVSLEGSETSQRATPHRTHRLAARDGIGRERRYRFDGESSGGEPNPRRLWNFTGVPRAFRWGAGGAPVTVGAMRVTLWGALAMGVTAGVGALFGTGA